MRQINIINFSVRYLLFLSLFLFSLPITSINAQETEGSEGSSGEIAEPRESIPQAPP
ncbi:MAG: hypothetical protein ACFCAD_06210 [Pleurocapsa sp.]